ncbi:MAG: phosphoadenosine phosphosulfate reductase [Pseudomonadota bacterium]
MVGEHLSADLTDTQWLCELEEIAETEGYFSSLGDDHAGIFIDGAKEMLFVSFETRLGIRSTSETALPLGFNVCEAQGWSHLTVLSLTDKWFRDHHVYCFFDRMVDEGFFEDYDTVVFYGAGMCGYAAAAFSVVSPGATVLAIAPQATLTPAVAGWDTRFPHTAMLDFTSRYGYAPDMLEAAAAAHIFFDPNEVEDAMHAALFRGPNIHHHRYRRGRSGAIDADFRAMSLITRFTQLAEQDRLTRRTINRELRHRRDHIPYLRTLLAKAMTENRPHLAAKVCRHVLADRNLPRFRAALEAAEEKIALQARNQASALDNFPA